MASTEPKKDTVQVIHLGFDQQGHRMRVGDLYWQALQQMYMMLVVIL